MKKIVLLFAGILCIGVFTANAQKILVKAGYNYANVSVDKNVTVADIKSGKSGWQIGVGYQTEPASGFSFQPELVYKVTGYKLSDIKDMNLGYLEVPLNVQWGPDLLIARPFVFAGPYVGVKVKNQFKGTGWTDTDRETVAKGLKTAEWGVGVGLGVNIFKFQIAGKYNWNFGAIADTKQLPSLDASPRTFEISVGLMF